MSSVSYADAGQQYDGSNPIPNGALSWGWLQIRPHNMDQGIVPVPTKDNSGAYLDVEIILEGGPWDKRKVWTRIGVDGKENWVNMGRAAIKAILEVGRGAGPQNPQAYCLKDLDAGSQYPRPDWFELNGLKVAVRIKYEGERINEKTGEVYKERNDVAAFLTPLDPSLKKDFDRLLAGDVEPAGGTGAPKAHGAPQGVQQAPAWGGAAPQQAAPQAAQQTVTAPQTQPQASPPPQQNGASKPSWLQ